MIAAAKIILAFLGLKALGRGQGATAQRGEQGPPGPPGPPGGAAPAPGAAPGQAPTPAAPAPAPKPGPMPPWPVAKPVVTPAPGAPPRPAPAPAPAPVAQPGHEAPRPAASPAKPQAAPQTTPALLVYPGPGAYKSNATYITQYQTVLKWLAQSMGQGAWDPGAIDGTFGPNTTSATAHFQAANGIKPVDGFFGPATVAVANSMLGVGTRVPA